MASSAQPPLTTVRTRLVLRALVFGLVAFGITWLAGLLVVLSTQAMLVNGAHVVAQPIDLPAPLAVTLVLIGGFGPALAAVALSATQPGGSGVRALFGQLRRWRAGAGWYVVAFLGPSLLALLAFLLSRGVAGQLPAQGMPTNWFQVPSPFRLVFLALGVWGEELGWRGYALPLLQRRFSALVASLGVGVLWFSWHQWPLFTPARPPTIDVVGLLTFFVYIVSASVLFAWLYNSTSGCLPIAWAAHIGFDVNLVSAQGVPFLLLAILYAVTAILVVVLVGPQTLRRAGKRHPAGGTVSA